MIMAARAMRRCLLESETSLTRFGRDIKRASPLHNIDKHKRYPAMLITTADRERDRFDEDLAELTLLSDDDRVVGCHS